MERSTVMPGWSMSARNIVALPSSMRAMTMVNDLFATPGAGQDEAIFKFASDVYADQGTEIERMQRMILSLPGK